MAFDLIADLLAHPRFDPTDLEREQKVILEEMKMLEDTPDELLVELFNAAYFPEQPLGRPIEGTAETVTSFDHAMTAAFHASEFSLKTWSSPLRAMSIMPHLVELVERAFANGNGRGPAAPSVKTASRVVNRCRSYFDRTERRAGTGAPGDRCAVAFITERGTVTRQACWPSVLGGGTSSRLWQRFARARVGLLRRRWWQRRSRM